jgi:hypothetical protein
MYSRRKSEHLSGVPVDTVLTKRKYLWLLMQLLFPFLKDCCLGMCCAFSQSARLSSV